MHFTNSAFRRCGFGIPGFGIPAPHSAFRCSAFRPVPMLTVSCFFYIPPVATTWAHGSVAEWSKALVLGTSLLGGVGSNPTTASQIFLKLIFYWFIYSVIFVRSDDNFNLISKNSPFKYNTFSILHITYVWFIIQMTTTFSSNNFLTLSDKSVFRP